MFFVIQEKLSESSSFLCFYDSRHLIKNAFENETLESRLKQERIEFIYLFMRILFCFVIFVERFEREIEIK